jgi:hypothetical protein
MARSVILQWVIHRQRKKEATLNAQGVEPPGNRLSCSCVHEDGIVGPDLAPTAIAGDDGDVPPAAEILAGACC